MKIWIALLVAPLLALADQVITYAMVGTCTAAQRLPVHGVHLVFFVAAVAATVLAWQMRGDPPVDDPQARRHRFLAGVATAMGLVSALAILSLWIPGWALSPCAG